MKPQTQPLDIENAEYLRNVAKTLAAAAHGKKSSIHAEAMARLGVSKSTLFILLAENAGYNSGRKTRADAGKSKISIDALERVASMQYASKNATGVAQLPAKTAIEIAQAQIDPITGEIGAGLNAHVSTIRRHLRRAKLDAKSLKTPAAHVNIRSNHPNQLWEIDASVAAMFYMDKDGLHGIDGKKFYKNKPENETKIQAQRVIRYVITDHYSAAFYVHYCIGSESAENLIDALINAVQKRDHSDPFSGVPLNIFTDQGSANKSALFQNLLERLSIKFTAHLPGNARATGQVEKHHHIVQSQFETRLRFAQSLNLIDLQKQCDDWRIAYMTTAIHTRHKKSRHAAWLEIKPDQLRIAPPIDTCRKLLQTKPILATVAADMSISHSPLGTGARRYDVRGIEGAYPKAKLTIVVNPYRAPAIDVLLDAAGIASSRGGAQQLKSITIEPMEYYAGGFWQNSVEFGTYNAIAATPADERLDKMRDAAWGAKNAQQEDKIKTDKIVALGGKIDPFADIAAIPKREYIAKRGMELQPNIPVIAELPLSVAAAAVQLKRLCGDAWNPAHYQNLSQNYPNGIARDEIPAFAERILAQSGHLPKTASHLRLVREA
ncbi:MAG: transposase family protein [Alphaproteobacteria bacterium]|nr:transposase family protein [Alphaproteobacteria bacterium]